MPVPPKSRIQANKQDPELVAIGAHLFELRTARGMTQEQLAEAAGLHWSYIGQVERSERNFSVKNVLRLERGLGIAPGELLRGALTDVSPRSSG